ncbi:histone acetyltransferase KAT6B-like isoform X4 [Macrobrachium rosenbergii]|uniref:histone acetyltransferase KAT6B-like isoform X4 n=1 Tax=Macrobrachium rosenbergii TaxID=79674 RepID=UPI0034D4E5EF
MAESIQDDALARSGDVIGDDPGAGPSGVVPQRDTRRGRSESRSCAGISKRGRRRERRVESWAASVSKMKRSLGQEYISMKTKKVMPAREIGQPCKDGCFEKLGMGKIKDIFKAYWGIGDYVKQNEYLNSCFSQVPFKRKYTTKPISKREAKIVYSVTHTGVVFEVCRVGFMNIHGIKERKLSWILNKWKKAKIHTGIVPSDKRAKRDPANKLKAQVSHYVHGFIKSLSVVSSDYTRAKSPLRQYLPYGGSVTGLFAEYQEWMRQNGNYQHTAKEQMFRKIFSTFYNISFAPPRTDECNKGALLKINKESAQEADDMDKAAEIVEEMTNQEEDAKKGLQQGLDLGLQLLKEPRDPDVRHVAIDLQQQQPCPKMPVNRAYNTSTARVQERLRPDVVPSQSTSAATHQDDSSGTKSKRAKKRTRTKDKATQIHQKMENRVAVPEGIEAKAGVYHTAVAPCHTTGGGASMEQRINLKKLVKLGKGPTECLKLLKEAYGEDAMSRPRVFEWHKRFKSGREEVEDDPKSGRPSSVKTAETIDKVQELVQSDRSLTVRMIAEELSLNRESVRTILVQELGMRKVCAKSCLLRSSNAGEGGRGLCSEVPGGEKVFVWDEPDCAQAKGRKTKVPSTTRTNKPVDRRKRKAEIKDSAPQPSTSKTKGSSRKKKKLQREEVEEEKDRKKLKLEEEDWTEETDPLALGHFQEIKIEEEDPLNDPYLLDEEANVLGASGEDLADIASVKQECTSWTDKSDQDTQSVVKAEEDFSQKKITSEQSETKKTGIMGKEVNTLWEKTSEDPARTTKSVPSKRKDNTQQEKSSQEERTAKRHRKVLKENSESDLTEFSQQFTKDVYDVFGMHVAKTLRDINNIEVFNRVKIKINDILLDALAGHFSDPGFKKKASVETQFPPVGEEISNTTPPGISSGHPPSQSFERKALTEKNFSAPKKGSLKTTVPGVSSGLDKTQTSSVDHLVNIPQHSRIPVTLHSINQPTALPVSSSLAETTHTTSVHPFRSASQHSRVPKTTHVVGRPATVPVTFIIPGKTQARTVDPHGTASKLPMIAVLPAASFGLAITQTRPVDPSRSISQSSGVPETAQRSTDATRTSTVDPSASISQHSEIPVTTQTVPHLPPRSISQSSGVPETAQRSTDATQTSTVDPSASISQHSEVPVTTQTVPRLPPRSISQSSGVPETAQRSTDATQTSTVDPSASISQHSEIPVTSKTISHLPQVPGKKKSLSSSESSRILALYNCTCYEEEYPR